MVQNFHLVWLDGSIDETNDDCRNSITKLRQVVNTVNTFVDVDECIDFINGIKEERAFVIFSGALGKTTVPMVHDKPQVNTIYIFCGNKGHHEKWAKEWPKVAGVYTDITPICEALRQATQDYDHNAISISFTKKTEGATGPNRDTLGSSFMYTQILKEILLIIDFDQGHIKEFLTYCREQLAGNDAELKNVDKIAKEYRRHPPIWWYTYECFLYSMLNRALRLMEVDLITTMGFFVRDLHEHIATLHSEQYGGQSHSNSFPVYRGQGLSPTDFDQLQTTQGGLLAFNNFLSTSLDPNVSLGFIQRTINTSDKVGVLFVMKIDPSISATPFANVKNVGYFQEEEEILFSMHSVFRIGQVKQIEKNNNRLWQVDLTLTGDHDPQLQELTKSMQEDTEGPTGWFRLGRLMMKVAQYDKAEQVFEMILDRTTDEKERGEIYYYLGWIKKDQGKYTEAITYYEKSLKIRQKTLPANHSDLATSDHNIGSVYHKMGEYSKALSYYEKALEIRQKSLPANHPDLAQSYNNIGGMFHSMGKYSESLSYYERALEIRRKTLPANHPDLAQSYNNIGSVYNNMSEYSKALSYYEKALEIRQKTLPANHPDLAASHISIGSVYDNMGKYSKALSYYEKALEIQQKTLPANHPDLAQSYNNIGGVFDSMGEYSKALSYYEKALEIRQKTLPANHPDLAQSYNNIGSVYNNMGEYSKALSYYEKALEIRQKTLPANHPDLATSHVSIGSVYDDMGKYSKALSYYEKALEIQQKTLPENHPSLATSYNNIGLVYKNMGEYSKVLSYYEKALEIYQKTLPENHPDLATSYNNIGLVYKNMGEYSKALSYYEKALEIRQKTLPANHPDLATSYVSIGGVYDKMGKYSKALSYYERALDILQRSLPPNHPHLKSVKESIEIVKEKCK
jgi:tetratricopeptide (TPR) repeat protein